MDNISIKIIEEKLKSSRKMLSLTRSKLKGYLNKQNKVMFENADNINLLYSNDINNCIKDIIYYSAEINCYKNLIKEYTKDKEDRWEYYISIANEEFNNYFNKFKDKDSVEKIDSTKVNYSPEGLVGYYLLNYEENAFEQWIIDTKSIANLDSTQKYVDKTLRKVCNEDRYK